MDRMREMAAVLAALEDPELIDGFLRSILTPKEIHDLSARWELVKRLHRGVSQRTIARELGLSLCKITRGSRELKRAHSPLQRTMERFEALEAGAAGT